MTRSGEQILELVAAMVRDGLTERVLEVREIVGAGIVNRVFDIECAGDRLVLRARFGSEQVGTFLKERWCAARAREAGIPTPEILSVGVLGTHAYSIQRWSPGTPGDRYRGDIRSLWETIGRWTKCIHSIEALGFGEELGGPVSGDASLAGWVERQIAYALSDGELVKAAVLTASEARECEQRLREIAAWRCAPRLCHGDLGPRNVLVAEDGSITVLDWGTASGHAAPELDLAELLVWDVEPAHVEAFLRGYGRSDAELVRLADRLRALQLWRMLTAARWLHAERPGDAPRLEHAKRKLKTLLRS